MMQKLKAGLDYPRSEQDLILILRSAATPPLPGSPPETLPWNLLLEKGSGAYIAKLRNWPKGFDCPWCGRPFPSTPRTRGRARCSNRKCTGPGETVISGTLLHSTKIKLFHWLLSAWFVSQKDMPECIDSLAYKVGFSFKAATHVLYTLRQAMRLVNSRLEEKDPVKVKTCVTMAEEDGPINVSVAFSLCKELKEENLNHWILAKITGKDSSQKSLLPTLRGPAYLLKRWEVRLQRNDRPTSKEDLQWFLDEFVFLENHRTMRNRGLVFYELIQELLTAHDVHGLDQAKRFNKEKAQTWTRG